MAKKRKLNSTNPKYKKKATTTGPVDIFTHELICTTKKGAKVYATYFKETGAEKNLENHQNKKKKKKNKKKQKTKKNKKKQNK